MKRILKRTLMFLLLLTFFGTSTGCVLLAAMLNQKKSGKSRQKSSRSASMVNKKKQEAACGEKMKTINCSNMKQELKSLKSASKVVGRYCASNNSVKLIEVAAKCNNWDYIFRTVAIGSPRRINVEFKKVEAKGVNLLAGYGKWLEQQKTKPYNFKHGGVAMHGLNSWITRTHQGDKTHCKVMLKAIKRAKGNYDKAPRGYSVTPGVRRMPLEVFVRRKFVDYMRTSKCKSSGFGDTLISRLESRYKIDREQACYILGNLKYKKALKSVKSISQTDSYFIIQHRVKIYPVRNYCRSALGKIQRS